MHIFSLIAYIWDVSRSTLIGLHVIIRIGYEEWDFLSQSLFEFRKEDCFSDQKVSTD